MTGKGNRQVYKGIKEKAENREEWHCFVPGSASQQNTEEEVL